MQCDDSPAVPALELRLLPVRLLQALLPCQPSLCSSAGLHTIPGQFKFPLQAWHCILIAWWLTGRVGRQASRRPVLCMGKAC